jgi:hypothetical protein
MSSNRTYMWVAAVLAVGCFSGDREPDAASDGGTSAVGRDRGDGRVPEDGDHCLVGEHAAEIAVAEVDSVDLLFVVDDSSSMAEEQQALVASLPRLVRALTTGDRDGDGTAEFPPVTSLHLGVVSTNLGAPGASGVPGCDGLGDDGILLNSPDPLGQGCQPSYPRFLSYSASISDAGQFASDFACITRLGTNGCQFGQPLEAGLKALWPTVDIDPSTGQPFPVNRILFLGDANGFGRLGHGDQANAGFLRKDPVRGLSVIAVVVVTDGEDCSSARLDHFAPPDRLPPNDPLTSQPMNLRCFFNQQNQYPLERYLNGLKALRPNNEHLVVFGAIAGVPPDLVHPEEYARVDWNDDAARDAFYDQILNDPRMQEAVEPGGERLAPSCNTPLGRAEPPRRLVQVARGFGANGTVQSLCQADFATAIDGVVERIGRRLGGTCLPRPIARGEDGRIGCEVIWELPPPGVAPVSTPTRCDTHGFEFLSPPPSGSRSVTVRGGAICRVGQLPAGPDGLQRTGGAADGWYYDDFSDAVLSGCGASGQRIAFTPSAKPPLGVTVKLLCHTQRDGDGMHDPERTCSAGSTSASAAHVGDACLPEVVPEDGFSSVEVYLETASQHCSQGAPCLVYRLEGDPSERCVPAERTCAPPQEVAERVYCTCRCNAPEGYAECDCPRGFSCVELLEQGSDEVRGGYCVRNGTSSR